MRINRLLAVVSLSGLALAAAESSPEATKTVQTVVRSTAPGAAVTRYLVALPHIAVGGTWRTQIVIGNSSGSAADVTLYYFGENGSPLSLSFGGVAADHTTLTVPAHGEQIVEPDWQTGGVEIVGWAGLVYTNVGVKIQGIFLWHNAADPADKYTEAAGPVINQSGSGCVIPMPGSTSTTMPFDETENRFSGYGFANTTDGAATLTLTAYDQAGQQIGQFTQQILAFGHVSFLLKEKIADAAGKKGVVVISGDGIVPLGLRFTPYYTFMTLQP